MSEEEGICLIQVGIHALTVNNAITRQSNLDPLEYHFYVVKLGFGRVYIIFEQR